MTMTASSRPRRSAERGQILTLVVLTMATMGVMAMTAITLGQALVRRHQAQLVVDAAAMAGAAEQAKGFNTIARINKRQLAFLNALATTQVFGMGTGYEDNDATTWARMYTLGVNNDWAIENYRAYEEDVFGKFNTAVTWVNHAYAPNAKPSLSAKRVIDENFFDDQGQGLFKGESPDAGVVIPLFERMYPDRLTDLVEIRPQEEYRIGGGRWYKPYSGHYTVTCPESIGPFPNPACIIPKRLREAQYIKANVIFNIKALGGDVPRYHLGNFYGTPKTRDIRFTYYLEVAAAKPIFGAGYLKEIPSIVVMASAKPYAGHLGDPFQERAGSNNIVSFGYYEKPDQEISPSYRAKLVPVRLVDRLQLAAQIGGGNDERFITVFH